MRRLPVLLALLSSLAVAAPAHAGEVTLWACHGPTGGALGSGRIVTTGPVGGGCDAPQTSISAATLTMTAPADLVSVRLSRRAEAGYVASADRVLESAEETLDGEVQLAAGGRYLRLSGPVALRHAALTVRDDTPPTLAVGGARTPATGRMTLTVNAHDEGAGLVRATAWVDGVEAASAPFGVCAELSPDDATIDRALDSDCPSFGSVELPVDTTRFADGPHTLRVDVIDAAGNQKAAPDWPFEVLQPPPMFTPTPTATASPTPTPSPTPTTTPTPVATYWTPTPAPSATETPRAIVASVIPPATPSAPPPPPLPALAPAVEPLTTRALVRLPAALAVSRRGTVVVHALCPSSSALPCQLRVNLKRGRKTLARGSGGAKPGRRARIVLRLSKPAQRTLKRKRALDATLTVAGAEPLRVRLRI
jgi:hypothetical protein